MKPLKLRNCYFTKELLLSACLICFMTTNSAKAQDKQTMEDINKALADAQTVDYCEVIDHPQKFNNRMIRVRALYETAFEKSAAESPACYMPIPTTWVDFQNQWEHRSKWRVRHALSHSNLSTPLDVVFIGIFKSGGSYGHMDMYPYYIEVYKVEAVRHYIEVYKVEAVRPLGQFRPLP